MENKFFIEANGISAMLEKLTEFGINIYIALPPPYVGATPDGHLVEIFMHTQGNKKGWMVHKTSRRLKQSAIDKYFNS